MKNVTIFTKNEPKRDTMDQRKIDFLNFENELPLAREKLNDFIYEYQNMSRNLIRTFCSRKAVNSGEQSARRREVFFALM